MLRFLLTALMLFSGASALAAGVTKVDCFPMNAEQSSCVIEIEGVIQAGDHIYLGQVADSDQLWYKDKIIASSGVFAGKTIYSAGIPRAYPLNLVVGIDSPKLVLIADSVFTHSPGIVDTKSVKIIGKKKLSFVRFYSPALLDFILAMITVLMVLILFRRTKVEDGWQYEHGPLYIFYISTSFLIASYLDTTKFLLSLIIDRETFDFLELSATAFCLWSLSMVFSRCEFRDKSIIEEGKQRSHQFGLRLFLHTSLSGVLVGTLLSKVVSFTNFTVLGYPVYLPTIHHTVQIIGLSWALSFFVSKVNFGKTYKRSDFISQIFFIHLYVFGLFILARALVSLFYPSFPKQITFLIGFATIAVGAWRQKNFEKVLKNTLDLVRNFHGSARGIQSPLAKLQKLTDIIQTEFDFSRVSLVSIPDDKTGWIFASSGPEAIPDAFKQGPRKVGPFLRRICRERHQLYAPVAEELGAELMQQGLKHSSLGIPLTDHEDVKLVLFLMANEDERIPPEIAVTVSRMLEALNPEILALHARILAQEEVVSLRKIISENSLYLSRYKNPANKEREKRISVVGKWQSFPFLPTESYPLQNQIAQNFLRDMQNACNELLKAFEFQQVSLRLDSPWYIAPSTFQNPCLREADPVAVTLYFAQALEKRLRLICCRPEYKILGATPPQFFVGEFDYQWQDYQGTHEFTLDSTSVEAVRQFFEFHFHCSTTFTVLQPKVASIEKGAIRILLDQGTSFALNSGKRMMYFSVISAQTDNRDIRSLENPILEFSADHDSERKAS